MAQPINPSRRRRSRPGSRDDRRRIDYTRLYIFIGIVSAVIIALSAYLVLNILPEENGETTYRDTVTIACYNPSHRIVPNGTAQFVFLIENTAGSETSNVVKLEIIDKPDGWNARFPEPVVRVPKESTALGFLTVTGMEGVESGSYTFTVRATSATFEGKSSLAEVEVRPKPSTDNRTVQSKDHLFVNYVGYLEDGRIFDTSVESVARSDVPKTDDFSIRGSYSMFDFTADNSPRDVIPGFDLGVMGMHVGQTKVIVVPPDQGYTTSGHQLYGKTLYFELTLERIERP